MTFKKLALAVAAGSTLLVAAPAFAGHYGYGYYPSHYRYHYRPRPVVVYRPAPVYYYEPAPVYYAPPPRYYYEPRPVIYGRVPIGDARIGFRIGL